MVDLSMLIRADPGIQPQGAGWMNASGEIAAQGVLTATGDVRAVLLVPDGDCDHECEAAILAPEQAAASPQTRAQLRQPRLKHNERVISRSRRYIKSR
jgi:hypothetical protein